MAAQRLIDALTRRSKTPGPGMARRQRRAQDEELDRASERARDPAEHGDEQRRMRVTVVKQNRRRRDRKRGAVREEQEAQPAKRGIEHTSSGGVNDAAPASEAPAGAASLPQLSGAGDGPLRLPKAIRNPAARVEAGARAEPADSERADPRTLPARPGAVGAAAGGAGPRSQPAGACRERCLGPPPAPAAA